MRSFRHQKQSGFTLIELVIVIVIIGILAAVAIPKFAALSDDATLGAMKGIGGSIASASATNYAACKGGLSGGSCTANITSCAGAQGLLSDQSVITTGGYSIAGSGLLNTGVAVNCTISKGALNVNFLTYGSP